MTFSAWIVLIIGVTITTPSEIHEAKKDGKKIVFRVDNVPKKSRNRRQSPYERIKEFAKLSDVIIYQSKWARDYCFPLAGDGTVSGSHTYINPGFYTITISVTDKDNGVGTNSIIIEVLDNWEDLHRRLQEIIDNNQGTPLEDKIEDVLEKVNTAYEEIMKDPPDYQATLGNLEGAVGDLEAAVKDGLLDPDDGRDV